MAPRVPLHLAGIVGYAAPPPGYSPPPVPVPYAMMPPPQAKTPQGFGYVRWALLLGAVMQAVTIPEYVWFAVAAPSFGSTDPFALLGFMAIALAFSCAAGIIGFVGLILFVVGYYYTHEGRDEYGPLHTREIDRSLIYLVVALVMAIVASVGGYGSVFSGFGPITPILLIGGAFGAVRGLFVGILIITLVKVFLEKGDRDQGWIGTALLTASPAVVGIALVVAFLPIGQFSGVELLSTFLGVAAVAAAMELVAFVLFFRIYSKVLRRIRSGEFPPIVRPPLMYSPYYPPPVYYPPYPVYPETPPPAQPPGNPPP